ncbi:unnamed protein product [Rhizophagus irregularis]|nr:unnamed protein product [Rhizophagus irregularis]
MADYVQFWSNTETSGVGSTSRVVYYINFMSNVQVKKSLKSVPIKRKQNAQSSSSKKRSKKAIVINSYTEDNDDKIDKENKSFSKLNELEYQE